MSTAAGDCLRMRSFLVIAALGSLAWAEPPPERTLTSEQIKEVIRAHLPVLRTCVPSSGTPSKSGYELVIEPSGKVSRAVATRPTPGSKRVDACITAEMRKMRFPASSGRTKIVYPGIPAGSGG